MILIILSVLLVFIGQAMSKNPPNNINGYYGFRTKKSMENKENWLQSQKLLGKFSRKMAIPSFILGMIFCVIELYSLVHLENKDIFTNCFIIESIILTMLLCLIVHSVNKNL
ncbi:hypothetical protein BAU15_15075 [Enterococcus sp. JM4C]|uniref:SdpI family protein n=1 Tax=Candidatus Enterococcus huntleyi TaxID=1857217 RepID=UPI00137A6D80|nr:SdpI family protein [Enterococcus sp. JM4C]KAF1296297.1 hypothetical protein BAU15_15075 [Enterococcus sp. JM4C]